MKPDLSQVDVELTAILGETNLTIAKATALREGDTVVLDEDGDSLVKVLINNKHIGNARLVSIDGFYGLEMVELFK